MKTADFESIINQLHGKDDHLTAIGSLRKMQMMAEQGKAYFMDEPEELNTPFESPSNKALAQMAFIFFIGFFVATAVWGTT